MPRGVFQRKTRPVKDRFLAKVIFPADLTGCWGWNGATGGRGYTRLWDGNRAEYAHIVSYRLFVGPIPPGRVVRHKCDNPLCTNPNHLRLGTKADNSRDMARRKRSTHGEHNWHAKLRVEHVREIRRLRAQGVLTHALAARFGVSRTTIQRVVAGSHWKHV